MGHLWNKLVNTTDVPLFARYAGSVVSPLSFVESDGVNRSMCDPPQVLFLYRYPR